MSNLSSLFNKKKASSNSVLKYERPSDPSKARSRASSAAAPAPVKTGPNYAFAGKVSGLYKLDKSTNAYAGVPGAAPPLGIAIVGSGHQYGLIIYSGNNKRFVTTPVGAGFKVEFQGASYINFYDNQSANWSIAFQTPEDAIKFATASALVRVHAEYHTNKSQSVPFVLKLSAAGANNAALKTNDRVGVQYQIWTNTREDASVLPQNAKSGTADKAVLGSDIEKLVVGVKTK